MSNQTLPKRFLIRNVIGECLLAVPVLVATLKGLTIYSDIGPNHWQATDWYISNDFGFVRRGIFGGVLREIASSWNGFNVNTFAFLITVVAMWAAALIVILYSRSIPYFNRFLVLYSPAFFPTFVLWDESAGGRKEALAIIIITLFLLMSMSKKFWVNRFKLVLVMVVLPFAILVHESVFLFCTPVIVFEFALNYFVSAKTYMNKLIFMNMAARVFIALLPSCIAMLAAYIYSKPGLTQVYSICESWQEVYPDLICSPPTGAFGALLDQGEYVQMIKNAFSKPLVYIELIISVFYLMALTKSFCVPVVIGKLRGQVSREYIKNVRSSFFVCDNNIFYCSSLRIRCGLWEVVFGCFYKRSINFCRE